MAETSRLESWFGRLGSVLTAWPRLFMAAAVAAVVLAGMLLYGSALTTSLLIAWDCGAAFYLTILAPVLARATPDEIRWRAARQDVGQFVVLTLTAMAALASVVAIYAELGIGGTGNPQWKLGLALLTIVLSWFFIHMIFAVHYAHEYFGPARGKLKGLAFPGGRRAGLLGLHLFRHGHRNDVAGLRCGGHRQAHPADRRGARRRGFLLQCGSPCPRRERCRRYRPPSLIRDAVAGAPQQPCNTASKFREPHRRAPFAAWRSGHKLGV